MNQIRLREFLEESPFAAYIETCWNSDHYEEFPIASGLTGCDPGGVNSQMLFYHVYTEKLKLRSAIPGRDRARAGQQYHKKQQSFHDRIRFSSR